MEGHLELAPTAKHRIEMTTKKAASEAGSTDRDDCSERADQAALERQETVQPDGAKRRSNGTNRASSWPVLPGINAHVPAGSVGSLSMVTPTTTALTTIV